MKQSTLVAAVVLALLGGYIYFYEREPAEEDDGEAIFDVDRNDVVRIDLRERGKEPVVLEKTDGAWRLTAPSALDADDEEVTLLLDNLETMRFERAVAKTSEVELASFGLDDPVVSVSFRLEDGAEEGLRFGNDTPTSGNRYAVRSGGDEVLVLDSYLALNFEKTAWDLRDKVIFHPTEEAEVERIAVTRGGDELVLARDPLEDRGYRVESPFLARADAFEADGLARAIRTAEMQALVENDEDEEAFEPEPEAIAQVTLSSGEPLVLEVGAKKDFDYYGRSPSRKERFLLDGSLVDDLTAEATAYVAKKLFRLTTDDVSALRLDDRVIEKDGDRWKQTEPEAEADVSPPEAESVRRLLDRLTGMSAGEVVVAEADEAFEPVSTLSLLSSDDPPREESLAIGAAREGYVLLRREGEGVFLRVPESSWAELDSLLKLKDASTDP